MDILDKILVKEVVAPVLIIFFSVILYKIIERIIKKAFAIRVRKTNQKRQETLVSIINNVIKYFMIIVALLMILDVFGIDTKTLVTSLGVVGLVAGLAVQDLLKDFISGMSIIFENQFYVGDTIEVNGFKGEVIHLGLKTTKLKSYTGEVKIIANRNITEVVNYNLANSLAIVDFQIAYEDNNEKAEEILKQLCKKLTNELKNIKGTVNLLGITKLDSSGVEYRITVETVPLKHYEIEREILKAVKLELEKNNITIPYPQLVIHHE